MPTEKLPPHSMEFEAALLGTLLSMTDRGNLAEFMAAHAGGASLFYDGRNARIFESIHDLANGGKPCDALNVQEHLRAAGALESVGGWAHLSDCMDKCGSQFGWAHLAEKLRELAQRREIIARATEATRAAYDEAQPLDAILDQAESGMLGIRLEASSDSEIGAKKLMQNAVDDMAEAHANQGRLTGIPSGIRRLDRMTGGFKPGQMVILAARPSVGKTSLGMQIAEYCAADCNLPVGVFSLEMGARELGFRMACSRARVDSQRAQAGEFQDGDFPALKTAQTAIGKSPLWIDDKGGLTIGQLSARARRMVARHRVKLIVVDYLGLMQAGGRVENRTQEVSRISNGLKALAKELGLPVVALCQLNRDSDREGARKPRLSDLRDSGSIEQDADAVLLLHRPKDQEEKDVQSIELIIAKHRNGPTGKVDMLFTRNITRFEQAHF